jgi:hypothetical protein
MSDWWTYRLSDFLLFSARTYYRLFELYNAEVWPAHLLGLALGFALVVVSMQGRAWAARPACAMLAPCWFWVAWAFHLQRYATINWAAPWFAAAFAGEGVLLLASVGFGARLRIPTARGLTAYVGLGLLLFALGVQPWLGVLLGRPWLQAEVFGLAPDPTALGTLGLLLLLRPVDDTGGAGLTPAYALVLWPIPVLWCLVSGATLWTMEAPDASLMPIAALLAVFTRLRPSPACAAMPARHRK